MSSAEFYQITLTDNQGQITLMQISCPTLMNDFCQWVCDADLDLAKIELTKGKSIATSTTNKLRADAYLLQFVSDPTNSKPSSFIEDLKDVANDIGKEEGLTD